MYSKIVKAQKLDDHIRISVEEGKSHPVIFKAAKIWSSCVWPEPEMGIDKAYFLSFFETFSDSGMRGVLHFVKELDFKGVLLKPFFDQATDVCSRLHCDVIYTDVSNEAYCREFESYCRDRDINIRLENAPDHQYPHIGLTDIDEYGKTNIIRLQDDTKLIQDLSIFLDNTITDKKQIATFYPVSALRYIITAFKKYSPVRNAAVRRLYNKQKQFRV
jgi:hypothetical protein